ncbi:hypothetical protein [Streptomyces sp. NPDC005953]|uniref:hypothetical protein n=1 Tax=Streptomyces sp. NPDC005953 TaxID=3156719 RepID=UPI0033DFF7F5
MTTCAAAAAAGDDHPCDGPPMGLLLRYRPTDFGGTMGCPRHTALLHAAHPGSAITQPDDAIRTMAAFAEHPDLTGLDEDLDTRYGTNPSP